VTRLTRRDFLNGVALTVGGALLPPPEALALGDPSGAGAYPPALTGLRGSHDGSFEVAHALRAGTFWATAGPAGDTGERYDLVVVGAGISGLAAAWFFRKVAGASARILVLDNHDDFGGHARRNEFRIGGRTLIGCGGTFAIDSPAPYSAVASALLSELGVDVSRWPRMVERGLYRGLGMSPAIFFDRETFGVDRLVHAPAGIAELGSATPVAGKADPLAAFLADAPLSASARRDVGRLFKTPADFLAGLDDREKKVRLARTSYADFLVKSAHCDPGVLPLFQARPHSLYGLGIDAVSALDAWGLGLPGFAGMKLEPTAGPGISTRARARARRSCTSPTATRPSRGFSSSGSSRVPYPVGARTTSPRRASTTRGSTDPDRRGCASTARWSACARPATPRTSRSTTCRPAGSSVFARGAVSWRAGAA